MKKWFISLITVTLIIGLVPNLGNAISMQEEVTDISNMELSINKETDSTLEEELGIEVYESSDKEILVKSELNNKDFQVAVDVSLNIEMEDIKVKGIFIDDKGDTSIVNFDVAILENTDDIFIAVFTDKETGQEYKYDSTEINASVLPAVPVVVAFIARWGVQKAIKHFSKKTLREIAKKIPKSESPVWKKFRSYKGKTKTSGSGKKQKYYEWDHTHNDIEVYDHKGKHLGSMDPLTGEMYKGPVSGRSIKL